MSNRHVTVSAAGQNLRMRPDLEKLGYSPDTPKPLLQTGTGETLLGRIVRQAMPVGHVEIFANYDTIRPIGESPDLPSDVTLSVNRNIYGPLGPLYLDIFRTRDQAYMAAGDFWADFSWDNFIKFHDSHEAPVTILVARSIATLQGARFKVDDNGIVKAWERVGRTSETDLINIGAYIVDPEEMVLRKIRELVSHKEDPFNDTMIDGGLMAAYVAEGIGFNVNNAEVYSSMVEHTRPQ